MKTRLMMIASALLASLICLPASAQPAQGPGGMGGGMGGRGGAKYNRAVLAGPGSRQHPLHHDEHNGCGDQEPIEAVKDTTVPGQ